MEKGKIRRLENIPDDLKEMQEFFIFEAENNTDYYMNKYKNLISSLNGNYICSDLFKETFDIYTRDIESRKKYSSIIHNSCAVLANDLFLEKGKDKNIDKCIFITGVPGAGKSFLIQALAMEKMFDNNTMIYEGDITTPTIMEKMKYIKDNNKDIFIIVVNPTLELAQRNAINRHFEIGRGASCETMARIISKIPNALKNIKDTFEDAELGIYNKKTNYDVDYLMGFNNAHYLEQGSYDEILDKLQKLRIQILNEKSR